MTRRIALSLLLLAAGCSRRTAQNYRKCLKLRVGMTREQVFAAMGPPEETFPYVEGKSLPHLKGRTAYEWSTPASMAAPIRVSFDDAAATAESIRCGDSAVTTAVYVEPPEPAVAPAAEYAAPLSTASEPARGRRPSERGSSSLQSSGKPLTE